MEGYKTLIVCALFLIAGVVLIIMHEREIGATLITSAVTFAGLRLVTNGPVGSKTNEG